ncbi:PepSY-associated TM helix domain-containing protein [Roseibacillus ishigakijimensis]|uniref:PepSY domain-containing protein n=1 Tax=Roseibacillus ishigakijimensis TaxID=454146 RepID=A0A934RTM7_9BACT|nr:PepSY-associated TM helix domain-containing protein [Roseibacillus ishigakijimensis]MBK1833955.1 PepSY domain-containing protein [Roseibacillus ishigakijimensis]
MKLPRPLRRTLFWIHLVLGVAAGVVIALLCFTGAALAFQDDIEGWAEASLRRVEVPPAPAERLTIDEVVAAAREQEPELAITAVEVARKPEQAWRIIVGRRDARWVNPYTGELLVAAHPERVEGWHRFFNWNLRLHRWLLQEGESRSTGSAINGLANLAFLGLALSGLLLWWPASLRALRGVSLFNRKARGKARDFNWHNVIGFWCLLPLVVMIVTGVYFSYNWGRNLTDTLLGASPALILPEGGVATLRRGGPPLSLEERFTIAVRAFPRWETLRLPAASGRASADGRGRGQGGGGGRGRGGPGSAGGGHNHGGGGHNHGGGGGRNPFAIRVEESGFTLLHIPSQILIHPRTGEILDTLSPDSLTLRQKLRTSIRSLHTGEAGRFAGKLIAFLACLGGLLLVYTGFALSIRRLARNLSGKKRKTEMRETA